MDVEHRIATREQIRHMRDESYVLFVSTNASLWRGIGTPPRESSTQWLHTMDIYHVMRRLRMNPACLAWYNRGFVSYSDPSWLHWNQILDARTHVPYLMDRPVFY